MIKPEQIPDEVFEAFQKAWAVTSTLSTKECLAAALNAWPGMDTGPNIYGRQDAIIHLPLTENTNDKG